MSYLNPLRLHFSGQFQANISTVNNDPAHFDNAGFKASYQQMQGPTGPPDGWFNPAGDANFRLLGCTITSAWTSSGPVPPSDPVIGYVVADSDESVPAKLVDLDPEQQLVSEIWGLQVRIADAQGNTLLRSSFEPAAFIDIWNRATNPGGDTGAGAAYQSLLTNLVWGDVSSSNFLTDLKTAAASGMLSIKFNVDGLSMDSTASNFMIGRITGTIGPAAAGEPQQLVSGRQFMANMTLPPGFNFPVPTGGINFFPAMVDTDAGAIYLDLGNALSTVEDGGALNDLGDLTLSVLDPIATPGNPAGTLIPLGTIPASVYAGATSDWYANTAGVAALPLTAEQLALVAASPLALTGNNGIAIGEWPSGAFLRADRFVYRMSPGDSVQIPVYATQWGAPLANAAVSWALDPSQLQPAPTPNQPPYLSTGPAVGTPTGALTFSAGATTNNEGVAVLDVTASDPGTPRWLNGGYGIDGQVYGIRPSFADPNLEDGPVNQWNFVSFLVWSGFTTANPITWADVQPVFQQYGNLYPVMLQYLDLTSFASVTANIPALQQVFNLPQSDPNSMPVTRDLSPAKRDAILAWLNNPLPAPDGAKITARGGKAAAMARRLVLQNR